MSTPEPIAMAFLGCGRVTAWHSRTLRGSRWGLRRHYASRSLERARAFEGRFGGAGAFGSYDDALLDPRIALVLVATPPASHLSLTLQALLAGKHVIVEKPAFLGSRDVALVEEAATRAGRRVFVAENYRYKPLLGTLRRLLEGEAVGRLRYLQIDAVKWQPSPPWLDHPEMVGAGALFEGGVHWLHLLASLGPRLESIQGFRAGAGPGPERSMLVVARFEGGAVGTLAHSWEIRSALGGLRMSHIYGSRGAIAFESNGLFVRVSGPRSRLIVPGLRDLRGYRAMFHDFFTALREEREPAMTLALARRDLELVEAAYRTADETAGVEAWS
jgi:predicted dehydrogenase